MALSSFDVVSTLDRQEADNALNQAAKELRQRYDFKNTGASIEWRGELQVRVQANSEERAKAALDVFETKLIKRGISLKALDAGDPQQSGKDYLIDCSFSNGLTGEQAKTVGKLIRDEAPKGVKSQIQGDEVRVSSKKRDDLQETIAALKTADFDFPLQYVNFR